MDLFVEKMVTHTLSHKSKLQGEHIENGYYVFFRPFVTDRSDYNAGDITVIDAPERKRKWQK